MGFDLFDKTFPYLPLDRHSRQIRLLVLHPRLRRSRIDFNLEITSFGYAEPVPWYDPLFYRWGGLTQSKNIFTYNYPIEVRERLWHVLDVLRLLDESRLLWIDTICID